MLIEINIDDALLLAAKRRAASQNRSLSSLVEEGLAGVLREKQPTPGDRTIALPTSKATGGTLPGVDLTRSAELADL